MLVDERIFFLNLDKNQCFSVDFIPLWSDLNVVSKRNVKHFINICSQKRSYFKYFDFLNSLWKYDSSPILSSNGAKTEHFFT